MVEIDNDGEPYPPRYIWGAFDREPHFPVASVNYNIDDLLTVNEEPY